jgi:hypothetical protein
LSHGRAKINFKTKYMLKSCHHNAGQDCNV